jgi:hypothetical protein
VTMALILNESCAHPGPVHFPFQLMCQYTTLLLKNMAMT